MKIEKRSFPSSSSDAVYVAMIDLDTGATSCNCRGWTFKRPGKPRSCKHTKELEAEAPSAKAAFAKAPVHVQEAAVAVVEAAVKAHVKGRRFIDRDFEPQAAPQSTSAPADPPSHVAPAPVAPTAAPGAPMALPMLASAMPEGASVATYATPDWIMEQKHDGHRLLLRVGPEGVTGWSRPGANHPALKRELPNGIVAVATGLPQGLYDGELLLPGGASSDVARLDKQDSLVLVLFDVLEVLGQSVTAKPLVERRRLLELVMAHAPSGGRIQWSSARPVSQETVDAIWAAGGEGAVLKRLASTYQPGRRSNDWVKVKVQGSASLEIVGFKAGKDGPHSVVMLRHADGRETTVKARDNATHAAIEANPESFLGRTLVISYNGLTTSGTWRHGVWDHLL